MKLEMLIQNIFTLFIVAIIIEASIMAIFSLSALREANDTKPVETAQDVLILVIAAVLCLKVEIFSVFINTGVKLPHLLDIAISTLVLSRMTKIIKDFFARISMK